MRNFTNAYFAYLFAYFFYKLKKTSFISILQEKLTMEAPEMLSMAI